MPIQKAELLAFIADYDARKGSVRKKFKIIDRSKDMQALARRIGALKDGNVSSDNLNLLLADIHALSHWDRNTLTGEIASRMRERILIEPDLDLQILLNNWTALSLNKGPSGNYFSIGFAKTLLVRIHTLEKKEEKEKFREKFIATLEYNPNLHAAILSEDKQYEDPMQQQAQRAIKNLLDGDPILATLVYKKFKRANKQLFEKHKAIWGRRSLTNAEQIFATLEQDEHKAFFDGLLARPLDPTMELNIVAAEEKLGQEAYAFGSLLPNRHQHLYLYGYHKIQKISHKSFLLRQNIKNIIKHILDHPNETELHGISAVRATVILRVKSFWKQVKPSWWDHFCNLVGWKSERISKLCAKSPLFKIEFDSPKNKLELLWKMFQTDLKPQDRSVIAHHICETWLAETTAETTHDKFFIYMTDNILQNQQLLAYALTIDRYRLILVQHEGVADLRELPPTSGLQRAIDLMHANEDVFIQNKMPIITSLLKQEQPRIPEESSAFVRHHLGDEGGTAALSDEEDELAAGAGAAGAAFQGRRQPAQASDDPHISLLARSPSPH